MWCLCVLTDVWHVLTVYRMSSHADVSTSVQGKEDKWLSLIIWKTSVHLASDSLWSPEIWSEVKWLMLIRWSTSQRLKWRPCKLDLWFGFEHRPFLFWDSKVWLTVPGYSTLLSHKNGTGIKSTGSYLGEGGLVLTPHLKVLNTLENACLKCTPPPPFQISKYATENLLYHLKYLATACLRFNNWMFNCETMQHFIQCKCDAESLIYSICRIRDVELCFTDKFKILQHVLKFSAFSIQSCYESCSYCSIHVTAWADMLHVKCCNAKF